MRLVVVSGGQTLSFPLRQGSTIVGRHSSCHISIPAKSISRRHCQIYVDGPAASVRDLDSSHGTYVNGSRVERTDLHDGDTLSLGGFQLRFETGEVAPQGAYAHTAAPPDDVVVTAEPAGMGPMPGGPLPDEPPPAPTDTPDMPDGEDTPVDSSFVPQPYAGGQGTALGAAMQPQLVVRDGRWFLRDPRTGREVEIAPRGGEAGAVPAASEVRRPNVRLLITAVAIAVVVIVLFASVFLRREPAPKGSGFSLAAYNRHVDAAIEDIQAAKLDDAQAKLEAASKMTRKVETARHLAQFVGLLQNAGTDLENLNWEEAERYLETILNTRSATDKAIAFAKNRIDWLDEEQVAKGLREELIQRLKGAGDTEELLLEILAQLRQLKKGTAAASRAKTDVQEIEKRLYEKYHGQADRARKQSNWTEAGEFLLKAQPYAPDAAAIAKEIAECRRLDGESRLFDQAREAITSKNYSLARGLLERIEGPGFYRTAADRLLKQVKADEEREQRNTLRAQILGLYKRGSGRQAIELLKKHKVQDLAYIVDKVDQLEKLIAAGRKAEDEKRYREAEDAYKEAVGVETDAENDYHRRAKGLLDALAARAPEISRELFVSGYRKLHKDADPASARKDFDAALQFNPENERAKKALDQLEHTAKTLWNDGCVFEIEKKPAHALDKFQRALAYASPDSDLHRRILAKLEKLRE